MKNLIAIGLITLVAAGCQSKRTLNKTTALGLLKQEKGYPKVLDYEIFCGDPVFARKILNTGLEKQGMVTVQRTQKLGNISDAIIHFTDAAKPYLLPTPEKDQQHHIQRVKIADQTLDNIKDIQYNGDHSRAIVEYTVVYKGITPFSILMKNDLHKPDVRKAVFIYTGSGWELTDLRYRH